MHNLSGENLEVLYQTMVNKIRLLIIFILLSSLLQAQQPLSKEEKILQQTVVHFFEALSNRDSVQLKNNCSADIALYESGAIWNLDSLMLKAIVLNTAADFKRTNNFDFINTTVNKSTGWVTYHLQSKMSGAGKETIIQWLETIVLIKERKQWKIKVLHSTLIKRS
jgi:hypothetical protein